MKREKELARFWREVYLQLSEQSPETRKRLADLAIAHYRAAFSDVTVLKTPSPAGAMMEVLLKSSKEESEVAGTTAEGDIIK